MNTNMVNIQREDHTNLHGIETSFSQTRVLPIVGKTSRAEVAVKSIDVQTKALPIFQPQVQIGTDINRLIYEVGLSATWRNSLLELPPDGSSLFTQLLEGGAQPVLPDTSSNYWGESTLLNVPDATLPMVDTYNTSCDMTLIPTPVTNTNLSVLFDYWMQRTTETLYSPLRTTCLTPVVVGSVQQKILNITTSPYGGNPAALIVEIADTAGFSVGDRVRFFGIIDPTNPTVPIPKVYATVIGVVSNLLSPLAFNVLASNSFLALNYSDAAFSVSFTGAYSFTIPPTLPVEMAFMLADPADTDNFQVGQTITILTYTSGQQDGLDQRVTSATWVVFEAKNGTITCTSADFNWNSNPGQPSAYVTITSAPGTIEINFDSQQAQDGYVINQTVKDGGHIEFLTDEFEFQPLLLTGNSYNPTTQGSLVLTYNGAGLTTDYGFLRGFGDLDDHPLTSPVEITVSSTTQPGAAAVSSIYGGYYRIIKRTATVFTLAPIGKSFINDTTDLSSFQFIMKLAPNFYTMDTRYDELIDSLLTSKKYNFMRTLGYIPTDNLPIQPATYPPTASVPSQTWTRAYTVAWNFSAYRNLYWQPQDLTSNLPRPPTVQQDFGSDSGATTYYNVYEFNKFLNDCVNTGIQRVITDSLSEVPNMAAYSLNRQLAVAFNAYTALLQFPAVNFVWSATTNYVVGDLAVTGVTAASLAFVAMKNNPEPIPTTPVSTNAWYYLGRVPYQTGDLTKYALCLKSTAVSGSYTVMTANIERGTPNGNYSTAQQISIAPFVAPPVNYPFASFTSIIPVPIFLTEAPLFHYNELTLLSSIKYDRYGFGTLNINQVINSQTDVALYNFKRSSWGFQGSNHNDEWFTLESNTSFKFLMDNFPAYCTSYEDTLSDLRSGSKFPSIEYWVWDNSTSLNPLVDQNFYEIFQSSESLSSCMSPVQSIVVVSDNIPVLEELSSPVSYLIDSDSSAFTNRSETISLTQKIIGEVFPQAYSFYNARSITRYEMDVLHYIALLDTKLFKQLEYSLYYRHRITQELVPLVLSNYGSVNIKFVFRPIS